MGCVYGGWFHVQSSVSSVFSRVCFMSKGIVLMVLVRCSAVSLPFCSSSVMCLRLLATLWWFTSNGAVFSRASWGLALTSGKL